MHHFSSERGPAAFTVCVRFPGNPMKSVSVRKPWAGNSEKPGPAAFPVCVRFPGNPIKSVSVRKPRAGNSEKPGPAAAPVCVRIPGNPMKSVSVRKPRAGNSEKRGPAAASVCVRFPGIPMNSVLIRKPRAGNSEKTRPGDLHGLRMNPRKPNEIGFRTQTSGRTEQKTRTARAIKKAGGCRLTLVLQSVPPAPARTSHRTSGPGRPGCF